MPSLIVAVGSSRGRDSRRAGAEAALRAREGLAGAPAAAALVFAGYRGMDHAALLAGVREVLGTTPLAGGTTFGEIEGGRLLEGSVVVWALGGAGLLARTGLGAGMAADSRACGAMAARRALEGFAGAQPRLFLVFYETQMGDPGQAIEGAKDVLGRGFPVIGAGTGSGVIMETSPFSKQFLDSEVLGGCFTGLLLGGDFAFACGYSHGGTAVTPDMELTYARENVILELDGRPALDVFEEALGVRLGARGLSYLDVHLAVQEPERPGVDTLRALWGANVGERTLYCGNRIDSGLRVRLAQVRPDVILARQAQSMAEARRLLGRKPAGALCFDCYGRKLTLGAHGLIGKELDLIHQAAERSPMGGLYSGSETAHLGFGRPGAESRYCHQSTAFVLFAGS